MCPSKTTGCSPCSDTGWNTGSAVCPSVDKVYSFEATGYIALDCLVPALSLIDCSLASGLRPESTRQNQHRPTNFSISNKFQHDCSKSQEVQKNFCNADISLYCKGWRCLGCAIISLGYTMLTESSHDCDNVGNKVSLVYTLIQE